MNFALREWKSLSNRSTFPLNVCTALNRPWNPGFEKKVGIFSFYLLRVSFSVRLNRIIILVERLMSLNGNLFSSLSFNRVWTIIPNPIHSFRIILFIFYSGLHGQKITKTNVLRFASELWWDSSPGLCEKSD